MGLEPLVRLRAGSYISQDGRWLVGEPVSGKGWLLRPANYEDLLWWINTEYDNHFRTLALTADYLRVNFREGTRPEQSLSSLVIDQGVQCVAARSRLLSHQSRPGAPSRARSRASTEALSASTSQTPRA